MKICNQEKIQLPPDTDSLPSHTTGGMNLFHLISSQDECSHKLSATEASVTGVLGSRFDKGVANPHAHNCLSCDTRHISEKVV